MRFVSELWEPNAYMDQDDGESNMATNWKRKVLVQLVLDHANDSPYPPVSPKYRSYVHQIPSS